MSTTGIFTLAREATFMWTPVAANAGGGGEDLTVFKVGFMGCAFSEGHHQHLTSPAGYQMERYQLGVMWFRALLSGMYDKSGATLPTPGGFALPPTQPGTLLITLTATGGAGGATARTKSIPGFLHTLNGTIQGGSVGGPQMYEYAFIGSASGPTDTITTT